MPFDPSERHQPTASEPSTSCGHMCPHCGGALIPLRGVWRCARCYFVLCAGCEPEPNAVPAGEE